MKLMRTTAIAPTVALAQLLLFFALASCSDTEFTDGSAGRTSAKDLDAKTIETVAPDRTCATELQGPATVTAGTTVTINISAAALKGAVLKGTDGSSTPIEANDKNKAAVRVKLARSASFSVEFPSTMAEPPQCADVAVYVNQAVPTAPSCAITLSPSSVPAGGSFSIDVSISAAPTSKAKIDDEWMNIPHAIGERYSVSHTASVARQIIAYVYGADGIASTSCQAPISISQIPPTLQNISILSTAQVKPTDVVFVFDNSESMADKIDELKNSMTVFTRKLSDAGAKYNAHIVSLSPIENLLQKITNANFNPSTYYLLSSSLSTNSGSYPWLMRNVTSANLSQVSTSISNLPLGLLESEPGIATAWAYSRSGNLSTIAGGQLHYIMLSDEDNALNWDVVNRNNGTLVSSYPIEMQANNTCSSYTTQNVEDYTKCSWDYINGTYPSQIEYRHKKPGSCQIKMNSSQDSIATKIVQGTKNCSEDIFSCEITNRPSQFSCSASGYLTRSWSTNLSGRYACQEAKTVDCTAIIDGTEVVQAVSAAEARTRIAQGASCVPRWNAGYNEVFGALSDIITSSTVQSCQIISCSPSAFYREDLIQRMIDFDQSAAGSKLTANCQSTTRTTTSSWQSTTFGYYPAAGNPYRLVSGAWTYTGQCPARSSLVNSTVGLGNYCDGEAVLSNLPPETAVVTSTPTVTTLTTWEQNSYINGHSVPGPLSESASDKAVTLAALNAAYGCTSCVTYFETHTVTPNFATTVKLGNPVSYPSGTIFTRTPRVDIPITSTQTNECGGRNSCISKGYCMKEVVSTQQVCTAYNTTVVPPTPANFKNFLSQSFGTIDVKWHSIVNLDGNKCPGSAANANTTKGTSYLDLSALTGGLSASICSTSFDNILGEIGNKVIENVQYTYTLNNLATKIISMKNKTSGRTLASGSDYTAAGYSVTFTAGAVNKGDIVEATFIP